MAALWRLPQFKFGDNPRQVSFTKQARPFQRSTRLYNFLKNLSFFYSFSRQWPRHQFGKMWFCNTFSWDSWTQDFDNGSGPYDWSRRRDQKLPTPSGHPATATFPWHGKLLPQFFAQVCTGFETFNLSPEGWGQNVGVVVQFFIDFLYIINRWAQTNNYHHITYIFIRSSRPTIPDYNNIYKKT